MDDSTDVELLDEERALSERRCPICSNFLEGEVRICTLCATPHHGECWDYNGGCATFGCGEATRAVARKAVAANECPLCMVVLQGPLIRCRACDRRHHAPCFQEAGGCGVVGCSGNIHALVATPLPEKISLPRLRMAAFLGVFYVTPATVVWTVLNELVLLYYLFVLPGMGRPGNAAACGLWFTAMMLGPLWALLTAERYNVNLRSGHLTRSKLLLGREIFEVPVVRLDRISGITRAWSTLSQPSFFRALLRDSSSLDLTPPLPEGSEDEKQLEEMFRRLHAFNVVPYVPMIEDATAQRRISARLPGRAS